MLLGASFGALGGDRDEDPADGRAWEGERLTMVERQIAARGIDDARLLAGMRRVPRH